MCTLIFGLIVNTIVTKIIAAEISDSESLASSLMTTGSVLTQRATEDIFYSEKSAQSSPKSSNNSLNNIEVEIAEEIPQERISLIERGSVSEGIIATLFRQSEW